MEGNKVDRILLHKENKRLEFINELILEASYKQTNDEMLNTSLRKIAEIIDIDFGYIVNYNDKEIILTNAEGQYNLPEGFLEEAIKSRFKDDIIRDEMGKRIFILNRENFSTPRQKHMIEKYDLKTLITVPIGSNDAFAAKLILLFSHKEKEEVLEYISLLKTIGNTLWILIEKQKIYEDYQNNIIRTEKLRALGELAGGIAHDFNNLLTTILGFSQIVLTRELSEDTREYMDIIHKSALDGKEIVDRIQGYNRKKFGNKKEVCSINSIVESSIEMARPRWKNFYEFYGNNLKIVKGLYSNSNIYCVEHEIREVIINLLSNAMDAMENGGILTIRTYDDEDKVIVEIGDTGVGIPEEIKEEVFEPFYSTKGIKGTGLGLSIAKNIIEDHNGSIKLESKIGEGTTLNLSFDRFLKESEAINIFESNINIYDIDKELNILVVDDILQVGETVVQMLKTIEIAADIEVESEKVINRLSHKKYDIIICDLAMPELNGIELSKMVKEQYHQTKFIIITGWPGRFKKDGYDSVDYIIRKPFTIEELAKAIKSIL